MKTFKMPDSFYEPDLQPEESEEFYDMQYRLEEAAGWLKNALDILYGDQEFDSEELEECFDYLSTYLKVKMKKTTLKIQSK
jgi:hypothetical protein